MIRAILGGSFDPVHNGHVAMARFVLDRELAQRVHVIPALVSPHKTATGASTSQRLAMVRLAFADVAGVVVDERELKRPGPSYTVDTLQELSREHPRDRLLLVIGQDNLAGLGSWRDLAGISALARVAVLARRPEAEPAAAGPDRLPPGLDLAFYPDFHQPVSSSAIRAILAASPVGPDRPEDFLPPAVAEYIARHRLYRD